MKKCKLDPELHECPYLILDGLICNRETHCSFQEDEDSSKTYTRKPKWFEKYYKDGSFM